MVVKTARLEDIAVYTQFAKSAQAWLRQQGLAQYVPAAHAVYADAIAARVASGTLYVVEEGTAAVAFFTLDATPSPWWEDDQSPALYLGGIVVSTEKRGQGIGRDIVRWCAEEAARRGCHYLRLDCHAENEWLNRYYVAQGFTLQGRVAQHPGYAGCLYQLVVVEVENRRDISMEP